jgi:hypothetical protein
VRTDCTSGSYTASAGATGSDSFVYRVTDGSLADTGTVTVTIEASGPVNQAPVAGDVSITGTVGAAASWIPVVSDPDPGATLRCQLLTQPTKGTASVRTDCTSGGYTASAGATGSDSFVYTVSDGTASDTGTVFVTIEAASSELLLTPRADAFVNKTAPRRNYGSAARLGVDRRPLMRSYLKFRVPELEGEVQSVTLRVYASGPSVGGLNVRSAGAEWREDRITWNRQPFRADLVGGSPRVRAGGWTEIELDVTSVQTGRVAFSLLPRIGADIRLRSSESAKPPQLVIVTK